MIGARAEGSGARGPARELSVLGRLQLGIESLYRVDTQLDVESFLIDDTERRRAGVARTPREQILLTEDADEGLRLGLFVDGDALANLEENDPGHGLDERNFADFCVAVEGVSHFVYLALCAADDRAVSALELELQAEVDKFACCVLLSADAHRGGGDTRVLRRRLYQAISFASDLDADERDRYRVANAQAGRYADALASRYVTPDRLPDMLPELRQFYRFGLGAKLGHIARVAG